MILRWHRWRMYRHLRIAAKLRRRAERHLFKSSELADMLFDELEVQYSPQQLDFRMTYGGVLNNEDRMY